MAQEKIIEVIKNLLTRTEENGCTPEEAASAAAKVAMLLAKHNITMSEINPDDLELIDIEFCDTKSSSIYQSVIAKALEKHFGVVVYMRVSHRRNSLFCYGEKIKVQAFSQTFSFIYKAYQTYWKKYHTSLDVSTQEKNRMRLSYVRGFIDGVTNEIIKEENANALVVSKSQDVQTFEQTLSGHYHFSNSSMHNAYAEHQGYTDGSYAQRNKHRNIA